MLAPKYLDSMKVEEWLDQMKGRNKAKFHMGDRVQIALVEARRV